MSFESKVHIEEDIEERADLAWEFVPSDGGPRNQNFVVLSIVAPVGTNQKTPDSFGIKIFGCFATQGDAVAYSKKLQKECDFFDYYVMDTMAWVKLPPEVQNLEDVNYNEDELQKLKQGVIDMRQKRAKILQERVIEAKKKLKQGIEEEKESVPNPQDHK